MPNARHWRGVYMCYLIQFPQQTEGGIIPLYADTWQSEVNFPRSHVNHGTRFQLTAHLPTKLFFSYSIILYSS